MPDIRASTAMQRFAIEAERSMIIGGAAAAKTAAVRAVVAGNQELAKSLTAYVRAAATNFNNIRTGLAADAEGLAELMRDTAELTITRNRLRPPDPSRAGHGRFAGAISSALAKTFVPTADGVIVRLDVLDAEAANWQRINFGAGGAAGSNPFAYPVLGSARPAFMIPLGFWSADPGGGPPRFGFDGSVHNQFFFPKSATWGHTTKGIQGKFFLEAAFTEAQRLWPVMVKARVDQWRNSVLSGRATRLAEII